MLRLENINKDLGHMTLLTVASLIAVMELELSMELPLG